MASQGFSEVLRYEYFPNLSLNFIESLLTERLCRQAEAVHKNIRENVELNDKVTVTYGTLTPPHSI